MNENRKIKILICIVSLIMLNTLTFAIVRDYTICRIINILFLNIGLLIPTIILFTNKKSKENKFLNYTKYPIAVKYGIVTIIMSAILMIIAKNNILLTIVFQVLVTGFFLLFMLTNKLADNKTEYDEEIKVRKMNDTKKFIIGLNDILQITKDKEMYKIIERAYDGARSLKVNIKGDPTNIDDKIMKNIETLKEYAVNNDMEKVSELSEIILNNFYTRNKL